MEVVITLHTISEESHKVVLEIPRGEITLDNLVSPLRMLYDQILSIETSGKRLTCKKGCSSCCTQMIPLSIPEVFFLTG